MNRTQLLLGATLLVQLALILLVRSPFTSASTGAEAQPLLPGLEAISPNRIELEGPEKESLALVRGDAGWSIPSLDGFPADSTKIEQLFRDLAALRVRRPIVRTERYHEAFHVSDADREARVRIWDGTGDDPDVDLLVGSSANYRTTHVRRGSDNDVYEVQGIAAHDLRPAESSWIRKELLEVPTAEVDRIVLKNVHGQLELEKRDGAWKVVAPASATGTALDSSKVDSLVNAATGLRLADAVGPRDAAGHGFASPAATLVLGWKKPEGEGSGGEATLEIGAPVADNGSQRYVTREGFGFTGTVWESSVKRVLEDDLAALSTGAGSAG